MDWAGIAVAYSGLLIFFSTAFSVLVHPRRPVEALVELARLAKDSHPMTKARLVCLVAWAVGGILYVVLGPWAGTVPWVWLALTLTVAVVFFLAGKRRAESEPGGDRVPRAWLCLHLLSELLMVSVFLSFLWLFNAMNAERLEYERHGLPQWAHGDPSQVTGALHAASLVFGGAVVSVLVVSMVLGTVSGRRIFPNTEAEDDR